jgi:hypothetical protein
MDTATRVRHTMESVALAMARGRQKALVIRGIAATGETIDTRTRAQ